VASSSSRLGLDEPSATDAISGFPAEDVQALGVLDNAVIYHSGTLTGMASVAHLAGQVYYATDVFQYFDDNGTAWVPRVVGYPARGYRAGAFTINANDITPVPIDTISTDAGNCFSGGRYVVPHPGNFLVMAQTAILSGGSGFVYVCIVKNGAEVIDGNICPDGGSPCDWGSVLADILPCAAGDVLQMAVANNTGTNLSMDVSAPATSSNYFAVQPLA
jgi:hypothetical protein